MIKYLILLILQLKNKGHEIILTSDAKDSFTSAHGEVARLISDTKPTDLVSFKDGTTYHINTYQRGTLQKKSCSSCLSLTNIINIVK